MWKYISKRKHTRQKQQQNEKITPSGVVKHTYTFAPIPIVEEITYKTLFLWKPQTNKSWKRRHTSTVNYQQTKDLLALDVEKSSCIGHDNNSHLSWVFTYPHVAMFRAALTSASATFPQCAQRKCLPCLMPI